MAVVIDSFEQRMRRPKDRGKAAAHYSGKKKQITRKTQVCVDWAGHICHISESVPGPTADITLLKETQVLEMLPEGVGGVGDHDVVGGQGVRDHGDPDAALAERVPDLQQLGRQHQVG